MSINSYQSQLSGFLPANQDLIFLIRENCPIDFYNISHIKIQSNINTVVIINGIDFKISKDKNFELKNIGINSLKFKDNIDNTVIITYTI